MALPPRDDPNAGKRTFTSSWDRLVRRADPARQKALLWEIEYVMPNGREFYANRSRRGAYDGSDHYLIDEYFVAITDEGGQALSDGSE